MAQRWHIQISIIPVVIMFGHRKIGMLIMAQAYLLLQLTPDPLTFNFTPDFHSYIQHKQPRYKTSNLILPIYFTGIISYMMLCILYGFDEAAGNFQNNNQGRGGVR